VPSASLLAGAEGGAARATPPLPEPPSPWPLPQPPPPPSVPTPATPHSSHNRPTNRAVLVVPQFCLKHRIVLHVVGRNAVPSIPMTVAQDYAGTGVGVLDYLAMMQESGLVSLWKNVRKTGTQRTLPARCDAAWCVSVPPPPRPCRALPCLLTCPCCRHCRSLPYRRTAAPPHRRPCAHLRHRTTKKPSQEHTNLHRLASSGTGPPSAA
jgi:hypothetical protein